MDQISQSSLVLFNLWRVSVQKHVFRVDCGFVMILEMVLFLIVKFILLVTVTPEWQLFDVTLVSIF